MIDPSQKIMIFVILPKYNHFLPIWDCDCALLYIQHKNGYGTNVWCYFGEYLGCTFLCAFAPLIVGVKFILIIQFIIIFGLGFYKELGYLLLFILINLIGFGASTSTNVFKDFFGVMGHFDRPITKNILKIFPLPLSPPSPPPQIKVTCFYIVLHNLKYIYICFVFYIYMDTHKPYTLWHNKFHFGIYIYMECKS